LGQNEPYEQSSGGAYVLRSKGEGNRHKEKAEMKSKIGQRNCEGAALEVRHQVAFFFPRIIAVDIAEHKVSFLLPAYQEVHRQFESQVD
jgi:hypothetical protein